MTYLKSLLQTFITECKNEIHNKPKIHTNLLDYQGLGNDIITIINNKTLEKDIKKYIAPLLYWNKNMLLKNTKSNKIKEIKNVKQTLKTSYYDENSIVYSENELISSESDSENEYIN